MRWKGSNTALCVPFAFAASLLVVGTVQAGEPITRDAAAPAVQAVSRVVDVASECDDVSAPGEVLATEIVATPAAAESTTQAAPCKPCKGRTWCKCTYNGMPRASCNPCCYVNNIGVHTCLD